ncbi:Bardet-Biedl syndrome 4 protein isoform X2 [Phymastichus coffea]|uniref:Bardet-Biedl syndrome 4 protein isoform X2 n=1 Tax=Phymastichus coffea TaxID=108790 RepID=UPI00273CB20C|nr:Bardet-Biedl syndrome 4 protein isoform X2 [Phymastichus coffea]XP_058796695.1 Bardet-Biedl syndrome 4 protein isoform X2 [Phymastichus coffea]
MDNTMSNGRVHQQGQSAILQRFRSDRKKAPPEIPAVESRNWLLHKHYTRHEFQICKTLIEQELEKWGGLAEYPHYLKGLILRREGKVQDALDCFQKAYNVNPFNVSNAKQIAKSLFLMGDHRRAIEVYLEAEKMIALKQPDWEIHYNLGECYARTDQTEAAKGQLLRAIELTKNESPYLALVKLYVAEDRIMEAVAVYQEALKASPESIEMTTDLGQLYLGLGDPKRAFQQFGTALAQSPNYARAILPMAYVMQTEGEYDVAFAKYKVAAQSMPESWHLWNNVGMCLYGKQKFVSAITCLKRAHYLNPLALPPACNLGIVFLATGQPASAAIHLCGAVANGPKTHMPYFLLGLALKRLDDVDGAERALEKAHSLAPQEPQVLLNYSVILDSQGKHQRARELLVVLSDVAALIDVDPQITSMAKQLAAKLRDIGDDKSFSPFDRPAAATATATATATAAAAAAAATAVTPDSQTTATDEPQRTLIEDEV